MNTLKDFLNNNKKYVYLMISILVIAVIIIIAVLVNIINKGNRDTSDTAGATIESRADSQVFTESTIDKSNINKNGDNDKAVSTDNESAENSDNDIAQKDDTEASKETSESDEQSQLAGNDNDVFNDILRSIQIKYPKTSGKITAKTQQWIVVYPDGSEYHFLFDGYNYRKMPLWND